MNYEWLSSFVSFAEKRNFTHTAKERHLSQPALHVQIRKLAENVGMPLYTKKGRVLTLTPEGKKLAAYGRSIARQETDVLAEIRGEAANGPVILAAGHGAFQYFLGAAISRFPKSRWPLRLLTMRGPDAIEAVRDAKAQLGVAVLSDLPTDLESTRLRSVGQIAVMPRKHRLADRLRLSPSDLDGEKLVIAPTGSPHRLMVEQAMKTEGTIPRIGVEATGWELMLQFVKQGMGIAVVNDFCSVPRGCVAIEMRSMPKVTYYLLARHTSNAAVQKLHQLITETTV